MSNINQVLEFEALKIYYPKEIVVSILSSDENRAIVLLSTLRKLNIMETTCYFERR